MSTYKLTQYSHGAGCGCKISPKVLAEILGTSPFQNHIFPELLVGNDHRDDAAVYDLGDGTALISTTDFFMPIVDDPQTFGYIASVNAISDVYAMGGRPLLAIAILGWPVDKLPPEAANGVVEGARAACAAAQIPLAGGHSIDSPEPIFGLAVTGRVDISRLKKNNGAQAGDLLYLTKPLGVGIYTTAMKKGLLTDQDLKAATESMMQLNSIGEILASVPEVHAMTDVTGFGLAGHLLEMCEASAVRAELNFSQIPLLHSQRLNEYLDQGCVPGGTHRNFASYGDRISAVTGHQKHILCDPQTSGGLLLAISARGSDKVEELLRSSGMPAIPIGQMHAMQEAGAVISVSV